MSLRRRFDEAHALLDEADEVITDEMPRARVQTVPLKVEGSVSGCTPGVSISVSKRPERFQRDKRS